MSADGPFPRFTRVVSLDVPPMLPEARVRDPDLQGIFADAARIDHDCVRQAIYEVAGESSHPVLQDIAKGVADIDDPAAKPPAGSEHFLTNNQALEQLYDADKAGAEMTTFQVLELARAQEQARAAQQAARQRHNSLNQRALRAFGWLAKQLLAPGKDPRKLR